MLHSLKILFPGYSATARYQSIKQKGIAEMNEELVISS